MRKPHLSPRRPRRIGTGARTLPAAILAVAALVLGVVPADAAHTAPPPGTDLRPATLPAGDGPRVPWLVGGDTIADGQVRVRLPGSGKILLGASGDAYVAGLTARDGTARLLRVAPDGTRRRLGDGIDPYASVLSADGTRVVETRWDRRERTRVRVFDATSGALLAQRRFDRPGRVLDAGADRVLLGFSDPGRTLWWDPGTGRITRVATQAGYHASIRADRLATFTRDPYDGGCTVVRRLSAPRTVLWRSCDDAVAAFSPTGRRVATVPILTDGLGARSLLVRTVRGGEILAGYRVGGWFGAIGWESARTLLLDAHGTRRTATVRCAPTRCERASRAVPTTAPRAVAER
ncbi:WD40 repeat domain-containing protein [Nocardioides ochotonae]|uniref:hypothetical protein n=1 Tax=Nocardioides ochotonae TaxID=2685869 RepID=UPI001408C235|nr:hypothetical protein [Nocardioides ochotonae]